MSDEPSDVISPKMQRQVNAAIQLLFGGTPASYTERLSACEAELLALRAQLDQLTANVKGTLREVDVRLAAIERGAPTATPARKPAWVRPVAAQANPAWCIAPGTEFTTEKNIGQMNLDDFNEFRLRTQFGYSPEGHRILVGPDLEAAYQRCEKVALAGTPDEMDRICMGAGNLPVDVIVTRILLGLTVGGKHGTTPRMAVLKYYPEKNVEEVLRGLIAV